MVANQQEQIWITNPSIQGIYVFQSDNQFTTTTWVQKLLVAIMVICPAIK